MKYTKQLTVKEWKKFNNPQSAAILGNEKQYQFRNFSTQKMESQEYITGQEILLVRYKIILTNHKTKGRMKFIPGEYLDQNGELCKESYNFELKRKIKSIPKKIIQIDINKTLTKVTKNLDDFHNMMDSMHGIGGKQKDLSGLLNNQKRGKLVL